MARRRGVYAVDTERRRASPGAPPPCLGRGMCCLHHPITTRATALRLAEERGSVTVVELAHAAGVPYRAAGAMLSRLAASTPKLSLTPKLRRIARGRYALSSAEARLV